MGILRGWKNFLRFGLNLFSVGLLLKTLFSPWRKYTVSYGRGFDFGGFFGTLLSNLIFRLVGAIIRGIFIFFGLWLEILIFIVGFIVLAGWIVLPGLLIFGIYHGVRLIF